MFATFFNYSFFVKTKTRCAFLLPVDSMELSKHIFSSETGFTESESQSV